MLRLFSPEGDDSVSLRSSLKEYFEDWYVPRLLDNPSRRPVSMATIDRRRAAVNWWARLMATKRHSAGPPLGEITRETLSEFASKLAAANYRRGKFSTSQFKLSRVSQIRTLEEIQIVLATLGPAAGKRMRAGLLAEVPSIYVPPAECFPKSNWLFFEACKIARAIPDTQPPRIRGPNQLDATTYHALAEATVALWFYTGHRATTYQRLKWSDLVERRAGEWYLQIESVKTRKLDRIAVHPQLLQRFESLRPLSTEYIIPWPCTYSAVVAAHADWQTVAGIETKNRLSPQAWRRLHSEEIAKLGFALARNLAAGSLGHSSASITESHYTSARDAAVLMLPNLF